MGLFSALGKVLKGVSKVAGFIPGVGGTISKVTGLVGGVLDHKKPLSTSALKGSSAARLGIARTRGTVAYQNTANANRAALGLPVLYTASALRESPVMPGGAIATSSGMAAQPNGAPPKAFSRRSSPTRKKRSSSTRYFGSKKKSSGKRKLKFGSKAWQAKYNPRSKRKRR